MLGGDDVTRRAAGARRLGIVYQHAYLFPHLTVRENVAYGAADAGVARRRRRAIRRRARSPIALCAR